MSSIDPVLVEFPSRSRRAGFEIARRRFDASVVAFDDVAHHCEADAGALGPVHAGRFARTNFWKTTSCSWRGVPSPAIANANRHRWAVDFDQHRDGSARARVLDRVVQQIPHCPSHRVRIHVDLAGARID